MSETVAAAEPAPSPAEKGRHERLRVSHILGATGACAVVLTLRQVLTSEVAEEYALYTQVVNLATGLAHGSALAGFAIMAWRWRSGRLGVIRSAGHWLLCFFASCLVVLFAVAVGGSFYRAFSTEPYAEFYAWHYSQLVTCTGASGCAAFFATRIRGPWWRIALWLMAVAFLVLAVSEGFVLYANWYSTSWQFQLSVQSALGAACVVLGTLGVFEEIREGARTDWLNWLGIGLFVTGAAFETVHGLWSLAWVL